MTSNTGAGQSPHIAAIEAARRTFIAALRKRDDAFADVQQHCPTAVSLWQYDETHETYLAYKREEEASKAAKLSYHDACASAVNSAAADGDVEAAWTALTRVSKDDYFNPGEKGAYHLVDWRAVEEVSHGKLSDCDAFLQTVSELANNKMPNYLKTIIKLLNYLTNERHAQSPDREYTLANNIVESAATALSSHAESEAHKRAVFGHLCAQHYLMTADSANSAASAIGRPAITWSVDLTHPYVRVGQYYLHMQPARALTKAAAKWRSAIDNSDGDERLMAQYAHMVVTATLLIERNTITPDDLATLIVTLQDYEDARTSLEIRSDYDSSLLIDSVEQLIDYAAPRMSM